MCETLGVLTIVWCKCSLPRIWALQMQSASGCGTCRLALGTGGATRSPRGHDGSHLDTPPGRLGSTGQQECCDQVRGRPVHTPKQLQQHRVAEMERVSPWCLVSRVCGFGKLQSLMVLR